MKTEFINEYYYQPFSYPEQVDSRSIITLPSELQEIRLKEKLLAVARYQYQDFPPRIADHVWAHVYRGVRKLRTLPGLSTEDLVRGTDLYLIHDAGETYDSKDVTIIDKNADQALAELTRQRERKAAYGLLPEYYFQLWEVFEEAADLIQNPRPIKDTFIPPIAVLTKFIDSCDGPMVFHHATSSWFLKISKEVWDGCSDDAFTHFWSKYQELQAALPQLALPEPYQQISRGLTE